MVVYSDTILVPLEFPTHSLTWSQTLRSVPEEQYYRAMAGQVKPKKYDWKDSNLALFGSDLDKKVH